MHTPPDRTEFADYYLTYIEKVPAGEIREVLATQATDTLVLLQSISEEKSLHRYADGKWTIRETLSHINDAERVFGFRGYWFARDFGSDLPSFDQDLAVVKSAANDRSWASHVEEFQAVRAASMAFWRSLPDAAWARRGIASGNPFSVRALAWITAGHVAHHVGILRERYL